MIKKPTHHSIIAKDNSVIEKLSNYNLSELRLIAYCLACYDSRAPENRSFTARVKDLQELFPMDKHSAYAVVKQTAKGINAKPMEFNNEKENYLVWWFSSLKYTHHEGIFEFKLSDDICPYLLGLDKFFTKYRLKDVYQFKAASTWKLYENLKKAYQNGRSNKWSVDLEALRLLLGIPGKYSRWNNFKQRVIEPAQKEINKLSDIRISYELNKHVRSVIGLTFFIDTKQPEDIINIENPVDSLYRLLLSHGVHKKTADDYTQMAKDKKKVHHLLKKIPAIVKRWEKSKKGPKQQYLLGAIKEEINQRLLFPDQPPSTASIDWLSFSYKDHKAMAENKSHPYHKEAKEALKHRKE